MYAGLKRLKKKVEEIDQKVIAIDSVLEDGIDTVGQGVRDLYEITDVLTKEFHEITLEVVTMKAILQAKGVFSHEEFKMAKEEVAKKINKGLLELAQEQQAKAADKVQAEIEVFKEAAKTPYDARAFYFGD